MQSLTQDKKIGVTKFSPMRAGGKIDKFYPSKISIRYIYWMKWTPYSMAGNYVGLLVFIIRS